ncbi:hypothetical protein AB0C04_16065 [Micromonospora sp. NPDC048909]|uniref:hypothetical protein n=1 Tax=Micromonospora sp. NPDC048909 TaxID=3155643 RepID=UPI0033F7EC72
MSPRKKGPRRRPTRAGARPTAAPSPTPERVAWWKRPVTWLLTIVIGAVGAWLGAVVLGTLNQWKSADELAEALAGKGPLVVLDVRHIPYPQEGARGFVYPAGSDLSKLDASTSGDPATDLAAVDLGRSTWEITLVGTRDDAVEVVDMRSVLVAPCTPPLTGIREPNESQGASEKIVLVTRVDQPNPRMLVESTTDDASSRPFFADNKISLPKGEKNVVQVRALSEKMHCRWRLELQYLADGRRQTMTVSAPGDKPFEVTGAADDAAYSWVYLNPINDCVSKDGSRKGRFRITGAEYALMVRAGRSCPY